MAQHNPGNQRKFYHDFEPLNFCANTIQGFPIRLQMAPPQGLIQIACTETLFQVARGLANKTASANRAQCLADLEGGYQYEYGGRAAGYSRGKSYVVQNNQPYDDPYNNNNKWNGGGEPTTHVVGKDGVTSLLDSKGKISDPFATLSFKERVMYETLLIKATQHPHILKWLQDNQNNAIIEDTSKKPLTDNQGNPTYNDNYWGNGRDADNKKPGPDGKIIGIDGGVEGRNALGRLWKMVQINLAEEMKTNGQVKVRCGFSDELNKALGIQSQQIDPSKVIKQANLDSLTNLTPNKADLPAFTANKHIFSSNMGTNPSNPTHTNRFTTVAIGAQQQSTPATRQANAASMPTPAAPIPPTPSGSVTANAYRPKPDSDNLRRDTSTNTALAVFQAISGDSKALSGFTVIPDTSKANIKDAKAFKLSFSTQEAAKAFAANAALYENKINIDPKNISDNTITINYGTAKYIFEQFDVEKSTRGGRHDLINSVIHDSNQLASPAAQTTTALPTTAFPDAFYPRGDTSPASAAKIAFRRFGDVQSFTMSKDPTNPTFTLRFNSNTDLDAFQAKASSHKAPQGRDNIKNELTFSKDEAEALLNTAKYTKFGRSQTMMKALIDENTPPSLPIPKQQHSTTLPSFLPPAFLPPKPTPAMPRSTHTSPASMPDVVGIALTLSQHTGTVAYTPTHTIPQQSEHNPAYSCAQQDTRQYSIVEQEFHNAVAVHPGAQVNNLQEAQEVQKLACKVRDGIQSFKPVPELFIPNPSTGGWKMNPNLSTEEKSKINGPMFVFRLNGKEIVKDKDDKPILDIVYYEKGVINPEKSFIAPDGVPAGSKSTVDEKTKDICLKHHNSKLPQDKQLDLETRKSSFIGGFRATSDSPTIHGSPPYAASRRNPLNTVSYNR